ncbi:MAG TPA: hypothetical protein VG964_04035 [Candidatus Saccharimonadales bacterium]|nr:hypothetical protein [Candidatus Saccharimonadales bacterium]
MPNIRTHNHIAAQVYGPEMHNFMLASALPAFRDAYNNRYAHHHGVVNLNGLTAMANAGISFHNQTDSTYQAQPEYAQIFEPLAEDFQAGGISPEASAQAALLSAEAIVDGAVMDCIIPRHNFDSLVEAARAGEIKVYANMDKRLISFIRGFLYEPGAKDRQKTPREISSATQKALANRATTANEMIPSYQRAHMEEVLMHHTERITDLGLAAVSRTIQMLSTTSSEPAREPQDVKASNDPASID